MEKEDFSYGEVERIVAKVFEVPSESIAGPLRGRIKRLRVLGIPLDISSEDGKKFRYEFEHICQWAFCLELEHLGLGPNLASELLRQNWELIHESFLETAADIPVFHNAREAITPSYLIVAPAALNFSENDRESMREAIKLFPAAEAHLPEVIDFLEMDGKILRGVILLNLSQLVVRIDEAIDDIRLLKND